MSYIQYKSAQRSYLKAMACPADAAAEKQARGALMSAAERCLSRKRTVIFDSHNNIKGYRYQLWCHARSVSTTPGP